MVRHDRQVDTPELVDRADKLLLDLPGRVGEVEDARLAEARDDADRGVILVDRRPAAIGHAGTAPRLLAAAGQGARHDTAAAPTKSTRMLPIRRWPPGRADTRVRPATTGR